MNRQETANLLTAMAAFDRRTIGESDVIAWQELLADIPYADGLAAVKRWYAANTEWMMPAHVRHVVGDIQRERKRAPYAPGQHGVSPERAHPTVVGLPPVYEISGAVLDLIAQVRSIIPAGDRTALRTRHVAWEQQQAAWKRQRDAEPNPHYRPNSTPEG